MAKDRLEDREGKKLSIPRVVASAVIALAVLVFVFLAGYMVSFLNYQRVSNIQDTLKTDFLSTQLSGELLKDCNDNAFATFSEELDKTGSLISILETRFGKDDLNVIDQKKTYSLIELQHFMAVKEYSSTCGKNIDTILFFYSNNNKYGTRAEDVGKILESVKRNNPDVMIYSFDYDLDMGIIQLMKEIYSVSGPNTAVLNGNIHLDSIETSFDVMKYLK